VNTDSGNAPGAWLALATAALLTSVLLGSALAEVDVPNNNPPESASETPAQSISPQEVIEEFHAGLLGVMKAADELGYGGRFEKLAPIVNGVFDTRFMAEKSIGRHWRTISEQEQERLLTTFGRYTVANYAGRFNGFTGEEFKTLGEEPSLRSTTLVRTELIIPEEDAVHLDYRLRSVEGDWKIIDVYLDGTVSELALRRSQYSALIRREGLEALIAALDAKMVELAESVE